MPLMPLGHIRFVDVTALVLLCAASAFPADVSQTGTDVLVEMIPKESAPPALELPDDNVDGVSSQVSYLYVHETDARL